MPPLSQSRVLVVGDAMLDRYWFGDVERISPEAPVPVVRITGEDERVGAAGNVARNARALGATVSFLSVVGDDEPGRKLQALFEGSGITATLIRDPAITTTVKLRVIARQQQLLRIDFEKAPSHEALKDKLALFGGLLDAHDVVIFSDYGKGGLTHIAQMIAATRTAGKVALVDPKGDDYRKYRGASMLTPNRHEFRQVAGRWASEAELAAKADALRRELALDCLLVTRSEEGMTLFSDTAPFHVAAQAQEVFDVTGAGDTVIATLGVLLGAGFAREEAVRLANRAGGIVVGKLGTAVVSAAELFGEMK